MSLSADAAARRALRDVVKFLLNSRRPKETTEFNAHNLDLPGALTLLLARLKSVPADGPHGATDILTTLFDKNLVKRFDYAYAEVGELCQSAVVFEHNQLKTVPMGVVHDAQRAALNITDYRLAIDRVAQTSLREMIGASHLTALLSERKAADEVLRTEIAGKTAEWGISVNSVEIRDVAIPVGLQDAMSRQAQAEREKEARFHMLEQLADYDDDLMEQLLSDMQPPNDRVFDDLAKELRDGLICPVLIGSAFFSS